MLLSFLFGYEFTVHPESNQDQAIPSQPTESLEEPVFDLIVKVVCVAVFDVSKS